MSAIQKRTRRSINGDKIYKKAQAAQVTNVELVFMNMSRAVELEPRAKDKNRKKAAHVI
jgi:hypothetical protein